MFIQRFNKRVRRMMCVIRTQGFLSSFPSALISNFLSFIDCPTKPFAKTLWQKKKKEKGQVTRKFSIENYYALQDAWWCLSLSFLCTDSIELFWGLCVCVCNCGSKADGMRIHQLAALHCVVLVWNVFFSFLSWEFWFFIITASSNSREMPSHLNNSSRSSRFRPEHDELEYYTVVGIR